jgi:hypothetical protein
MTGSIIFVGLAGVGRGAFLWNYRQHPIRSLLRKLGKGGQQSARNLDSGASVDDMIAAVDKERLAGKQLCAVRSEKSDGGSDVVDRN